MYCGSTNESIVSLNNSMQVVFNTDQNREFRGFLVTYKTGSTSFLSESVCHVILSSTFM